ncbi:MAG: hypothetical protein ACXVBE_16800 [Bdellovibrionota bacterium]
MPRKTPFFARALSIFLACGMLSPAYAGNPVESSPELTISKNVDTRALVNANPDYVKTLSERLKALGAKKVVCTSGYRSPEQQRAACHRICGADSCPNLCAPPGRSQHQQLSIATCDLGGMPANSCWELKKLCDDKYGGKCGVGGYPGGGYHFGVNDNHFSRWNRCAGLPREPGSYAPDYKAPASDPSPGSGTGSELDATEESNSHEVILLAAVAAAGVGGVLLYNKLRKK